MRTKKDKALTRTVSILVGLTATYLSYYHANAHSRGLLSVLGIGLTLWGCYLWTSLKNRHWLFMMCGLLSPIGLLGIVFLRDKSADIKTKDHDLSAREGKQ
jgi:hypothetical protein